MSNDEMGFWEHMDALRGAMLRSVIVIGVLAVVAFLNRALVFDEVLLAPGRNTFVTNRLLCRFGEWINSPSLCFDEFRFQIINIRMSGQFTMHLYSSFVAGLVVAMPYIIWEAWRFVQPALSNNERKNSAGTVWVISLLFIGGILFSYFLIVPLTLQFLGTYQISATVTNQISLTSFVSTVVSVTLGVGLVFELPVVVWFLARMGLLTAEFMRSHRKITLVLVLVLAAIITPPDVFSQILVGVPLYLLYELSIGIAARVEKKMVNQN